MRPPSSSCWPGYESPFGQGWSRCRPATFREQPKASHAFSAGESWSRPGSDLRETRAAGTVRQVTSSPTQRAEEFLANSPTMIGIITSNADLRGLLGKDSLHSIGYRRLANTSLIFHVINRPNWTPDMVINCIRCCLGSDQTTAVHHEHLASNWLECRPEMMRGLQRNGGAA